MTVDPDAQAFADTFAADPTDDDTLDHHAARMVARYEEEGKDELEMARDSYQFWAKGGTRHVADCPFFDHPFHFHIWRRQDAASIVSDLAVAAEHPAPDWREFQELVWTGRLDDTLRAEVAWG